ncbi:MAG: DUF6786 family protein [Armatimonadota bacterium]
MQDKLSEVLSSVGKPTLTFKSPDGSEVLVLPYGGRVLGLFAPDSETNFYWTNTALDSVESAREFYSKDQWHNSGGDRTWFAPEIDLFFPNYPDRDVYFQQRSFDPGNYKVLEENGGFKLFNKFSITNYRTKKEIALEITKWLGPAPNPLRHERGIDLGDVVYAGYTQYASLKIVGDDKDARVGLWNLVQMPHGGELLVPTFARTRPTLVFGSIPSDDLVAEDHMVRYRMRQQGEHKIAIRAVATTGRVGYIYQADGQWSLIVRNFAVNPSGEYVDVPWEDLDDLGYSTQACNVNSNLGTFSELEYHIPAIGVQTGRSSCNDEAQVWAFRGTESDLKSIARVLLGAEF